MISYKTKVHISDLRLTGGTRQFAGEIETNNGYRASNKRKLKNIL